MDLELPSDFKEFLRLLNAHAVEYLVVGGYAVAAHGYVRYTGDLDIVVTDVNSGMARFSFGFSELTDPGEQRTRFAADEAARLGKELTPFGAEKAGNKDGTIPEFTGVPIAPPAPPAPPRPAIRQPSTSGACAQVRPTA